VCGAGVARGGTGRQDPAHRSAQHVRQREEPGQLRQSPLIVHRLNARGERCRIGEQRDALSRQFTAGARQLTRALNHTRRSGVPIMQAESFVTRSRAVGKLNHRSSIRSIVAGRAAHAAVPGTVIDDCTKGVEAGGRAAAVSLQWPPHAVCRAMGVSPRRTPRV